MKEPADAAYVCVFVFVCVCMCVCVRVYLCVCVYVFVRVVCVYVCWRNVRKSSELMGASMTRSSVYGEGKHHGSQHEVDLRHLHATFCRRLLNVTQRRGLC